MCFEENLLNQENHELGWENDKLKRIIASAKAKVLQENDKINREFKELKDKFVARLKLFKEHFEGHGKGENVAHLLSQVHNTL